ncbi:MAG: cytochrome c oxidase subunit 4 [Candidatus Marinamargulisbacteria bacterium]|jgi:cytochrome c oxidase subunit 4
MSETHDEHSHHFIIPLKYLLGTFVGLLILTFITVIASRFDFGSFNLLIAICIAVVKASLVGLFFMGLRWDKGFNVLILIGSLIFLGIFFVLTFSDTAFRGTIHPSESGTHNIRKLVQPPSQNLHHSGGNSHSDSAKGSGAHH